MMQGINNRIKKNYGSINGDELGNTTCPTCEGTGRIPRGQEENLVAVISCTDQRLRPRHTKLYVCISVGLCLLTCILVLFFFFPRSITLSPVSVLSVIVYHTPTSVNMSITNVINITNENFVSVDVCDLALQILSYDTVIGNVMISSVTTVKPRSQKSYTYKTPVSIEDDSLVGYCKSASIRIHMLYLHLQMKMNVVYLSHTEQLSMDTFEYIDCGANTTVPHPV